MPKRLTAKINTGWTLLPGQKRYFESDVFLTGYVGGFGSGKSEGGAKRDLRHAADNPGCAGAVVCPSMPMAKKTMIPALESNLRELGLNYSVYKSGPYYFDIPFFDHRIYILSSNIPESLRGPTLSWVHMDEPFIQPIRAFEEMLARIRDPKAKSLQFDLTGTPEELNWGFDLFENTPPNGEPVIYATDKDGNETYMRLIQVSTRENTFLPSGYVATLEAQYDPRMVQAFIDGEFVPLTKGPVYYMFDRAMHIKPLEYQRGMNTFITWDFNVDPMSVLIGQYDRKPIVYFLREVSIRGSNTWEAARETRRVLDKVGHVGPLEVFGDASGHSRSTVSAQTNQSDYDLIRQVFPHATYRIPNANPPLAYRFNANNAQLLNAKGEIGEYVDPSCKELIKDCLQMSYKSGTKEIDKKDKSRGHKSDARDYAVLVITYNGEGSHFTGVAI